MLCNAINRNIDTDLAPTWAPRRRPARNWQAVDRALRDIAKRRAALDAEEARWLCEAEAIQIWKPLGMVSLIDYLERVLGYAPRTAQDRVRVARALGDLPQLTNALSSGRLSFSAVRELTRVATPATEAAWVAAAKGKNVHQIEALVADHHPGDNPDDPPDPSVRTHVVRFELPAEIYALLRQARMVLDDEHGTNLPDDAFVAALCHAVLDGAPTTNQPAARSTRSRSHCADAASRAGRRALARRSRSIRLPSSPRSAMPSTSDRSMAMYPSARTRTSRPQPCAWSGAAMAAAAASRAVGPHAVCSFTTSFIAPTVARTTHRTSRSCVPRATRHTTAAC